MAKDEELPNAASRRSFLTTGLATLVSYSLLRQITTTRALAEPVRSAVDAWVTEVQEICRDLKRSRLAPAAWQERIGSLMSEVSREELLRAIDFEALERRLSYPDLGVDTEPVRFPGFGGVPSGLSFYSKVFGMEEDRAIIPHGHRNMVSAHLVIGGTFHLRQYQREEDDGEALIVRPTVDRLAGPGEASSISDERNNVHWLIARGGRAYTLDVIVTGVGVEGEGYGIDNLDPEGAETLSGGLLRMPKLGLEEALRRYGKDHHGPS